MDPSSLPVNRLDPRAKTAWRIQGAIGSVLLMVAVVVYSALLLVVEAPTILWWPVLVATLVGIALWLGPLIEVRYRRWRWQVTEIEVRLQSGLIIITRTVIPMARIQHVDTSQGPILRMFDLSEVHVYTAAGEHKIPMLADKDAEEIRDRIATLAQVTDDGGL